MKTVPNKLRVLHHAQVTCKPFSVDVQDEEQALLVSDALANQHLFLFNEGIISDYSNVISVVMLDEDGEFTDYWNEEEGMDFDEFTEAYLIKND